MRIELTSKSAKSNPPRRAATALELAMVMPILLAFLVGAVDFCRMFYQYTIVTECARNGALYAADATAAQTSPYTVSGNQALSIQNAALASAGSLSPTPTVTSVVTASYAQVTVNYTFKPVTSYLGFGTYTVSRSIQMTISPSP